MAGKDVAQTEASMVGYNPDDFEWTTVHVEQADQITFDEIGDTLIAEYLGQETIEFATRDGEMDNFVQLKFMLPGNVPAVVNAGYDLLQAYKGIPTGHITRTVLMKFVDVGQASEMKSYRVDVGKPVQH